MANGKHTYGSDGGGTVSITVPSGVTTNTTVTLQDKNGTVSRLEDNGGRKNYLINGNFDKWDYATSQTIPGYGSDNRWHNANVGSTKVHSRIACTDVERALFNASYFSRTVVSSVAGANNYVNKLQTIEDITKLAGKTITLSFWAKADGNKNIAFKTLQCFGTGGSPSVTTTHNQQLISLTTIWQKKFITFTLPSLIGKTLGTDGVHTSYTRLDFEFDLGSSLAYAGMIQQSGTFDIAQVKLEDGSVATDGWHPYDGEFGSEVQACERYYWKIPSDYLSHYGYGLAGNDFQYHFKLPAKMRVVPSIDYNVVTTINCSAQTGIANSEYLKIRLIVTANGAFAIYYSGTSQYASAEL